MSGSVLVLLEPAFLLVYNAGEIEETFVLLRPKANSYRRERGERKEEKGLVTVHEEGVFNRKGLFTKSAKDTK
jgi:hypothetical protein